MDAAELMNKLIKLERAIGAADVLHLRNLVMDAQVALLEMQRHSVHALQTTARKEAAAQPRPGVPDWREIASSTARKPPASEKPDEPATHSISLRRRSLA